MATNNERIIQNLLEQVEVLKSQNELLRGDGPYQIFDPHFHIWSTEADGPHDAKILGESTEGHANYHIGHVEAHLDKTDARFQHVGGVFLEAMSVCFVDTPGPDHQKNCLAEAAWAAADIDQRSSLQYMLVPTACLEDPDVATTLAVLAKNPNVRGIRQIVNHEPNWPRQGNTGDLLLSHPQWADGYAKLADVDFSFDLQLNPPQFAAYAAHTAKHPGTTVIINHMGTPTLADLTDPSKSKVYWDGMAAFAQQPHCYIKLSMLGYVDQQWDQNETVVDAVRRVIGLFGSTRCMVASNHPADLPWTARRNYAAFASLFTALGLSTDEQRGLFGGNARRAYRVGA